MAIPTQEPLPRLLNKDQLPVWADQLVARLEQHLRVVQLSLTTIKLVNGTTNNLNIQNGMLLRLIGPTGAFTLTGFSGGFSGRLLVIHNTTAQNMTLANESGASSAANRILTMSGANVTSTGECSAMLVYDTSRWILTSFLT